MNQNDIHKLIEKQRAYFYSNETLNRKTHSCVEKTKDMYPEK